MFGWGRERRKAPPVIDTDYLARLCGHVGEHVLDELLADGQIELADRLQALRLAVADGDVARIRHLAHDMAGLAGHLGLAALSRTAADTEREIRSAEDKGTCLAAVGLAAPLIEAGEMAQDTLRTHLAGRR